jgi:hypothetical protein
MGHHFTTLPVDARTFLCTLGRVSFTVILTKSTFISFEAKIHSAACEDIPHTMVETDTYLYIEWHRPFSNKFSEASGCLIKFKHIIRTQAHYYVTVMASIALILFIYTSRIFPSPGKSQEKTTVDLLRMPMTFINTATQAITTRRSREHPTRAQCTH